MLPPRMLAVLDRVARSTRGQGEGVECTESGRLRSTWGGGGGRLIQQTRLHVRTFAPHGLQGCQLGTFICSFKSWLWVGQHGSGILLVATLRAATWQPFKVEVSVLGIWPFVTVAMWRPCVFQSGESRASNSHPAGCEGERRKCDFRPEWCPRRCPIWVGTVVVLKLSYAAPRSPSCRCLAYLPSR